MTGNLYIITNNINNKVYIGKTYTSLNERWNRHISDAFRTDRVSNSKLYNALRKYGTENFSIELIGQFDEGILEQKEMEYIQKYNSYNNGYNSTLGGEGNRKISNETTEDVINMYRDNTPITKIALISGINVASVRRILSNSTEYKPIKDIGKQVVMYNKDFEPECVYESILEASKYIIGDVMHFRINIKHAFNKGIILYGHRWQQESDLIYEGKIFRTKFDKEAYINGGYAYKPENKKYYVVDGALDNIHGVKKINYCSNCHKQISKRANMCTKCNSISIVNNSNKIPKPSLEQLAADRKEMTLKQIAQKYGRSTSTIHGWLKDI